MVNIYSPLETVSLQDGSMEISFIQQRGTVSLQDGCHFWRSEPSHCRTVTVSLQDGFLSESLR